MVPGFPLPSKNLPRNSEADFHVRNNRFHFIPRGRDSNGILMTDNAQLKITIDNLHSFAWALMTSSESELNCIEMPIVFKLFT